MDAYIKKYGYDAIIKILQFEFRKINWEEVWSNDSARNKCEFYINITQDRFYNEKEDVCFCQDDVIVKIVFPARQAFKNKTYDFLVVWLFIKDGKLQDDGICLEYKDIMKAISRYSGENYIDPFDKSPDDYDYRLMLYSLLKTCAKYGTVRKIDFFDYVVGMTEYEKEIWLEAIDPETSECEFDYEEEFSRKYDEINEYVLSDSIEIKGKEICLFDFLILITLIAVKDDFVYSTQNKLCGRRLAFYCYLIAWVNGACNLVLFEWMKKNKKLFLKGGRWGKIKSRDWPTEDEKRKDIVSFLDKIVSISVEP